MVKSLTGLTIQEIETLLPTFESALDSSSGAWTSVKDSERQRRRGGGRVTPVIARRHAVVYPCLFQDLSNARHTSSLIWRHASVGKPMGPPVDAGVRNKLGQDIVATNPVDDKDIESHRFSRAMSGIIDDYRCNRAADTAT